MSYYRVQDACLMKEGRYPGYGFPSCHRQVDTRRIPLRRLKKDKKSLKRLKHESSFPRIRSVSKIIFLEDAPVKKEHQKTGGSSDNPPKENYTRRRLMAQGVRFRKMIGNRNGSAKEWRWQNGRPTRTLPRSASRLEVKREVREELAVIADMQAEDIAIANLEYECDSWAEAEYMARWERELLESRRRRELLIEW